MTYDKAQSDEMTNAGSFFRRAALACLLWLAALAATASETMSIELAEGRSYTDHLALAGDSKDTDLMVKFIFNENENSLTVSLISYRKLFVFREDSKYSQVVHNRRLHPDDLPYVVTYAPRSSYKLSYDLRHSLPSPRCKYVFHRWASGEGLQAVPEEYKMVNDFIEQKFMINGADTLVTLSLRDVAVMEQTSKPGKKKEKYKLTLLSDLGKTYKISIRRNPCLGKDEDIAASAQLLQNATAAYETFDKQYAGKVLKSSEEIAIFRQIKELLTTQYQPIAEVSPCPDIQANRDAYNAVARSIAGKKYRTAAKNAGQGVEAEYLLAQARILDNSVAQWLLTGDKAMRNDLEAACRKAVNSTNEQIKMHGVKTKAQKDALKIFRQAEAYYKANCK